MGFFQEMILYQVGRQTGQQFLLAKFTNIEKKENEMVTKFTGRFSKLYARIPQAIHPSDGTTLIFYNDAFDKSFVFSLREKDPQNLEASYATTLKIEKNMNVKKQVRSSLSYLSNPH